MKSSFELSDDLARRIDLLAECTRLTRLCVAYRVGDDVEVLFVQHGARQWPNDA